jgi:hypothetical protein
MMPERLRGMLARTGAAAGEWPVELDLRVTEDGHELGGEVGQAHLICSAPGCGQSVLCLAKDVRAGAAVVSAQIITAAITRHYREAHCDGGGLPL